MSKKAVFLHIEKSAGTSFRNFAKSRTNQEGAIFWWNKETNHLKIDSPEVKKSHIIGGHKRIDFYKGMNALYLAVVREPVDRVVSLFNYHATKHVMSADGFNPDSLEDTLKNCEFFRRKIQGAQCRYLGGEASFESALTSLQARPFIVGSFDHIDNFNKRFFGAFGLATESFGNANVGRAGYKDQIILTEHGKSILNDLLVEDYKLYDFINSQSEGVFENQLNKVDWFSLRQAFFSEKVITPTDISKKLVSSTDFDSGQLIDAEDISKLSVEAAYSYVRESLSNLSIGEVSRLPGIGRFIRSETPQNEKKLEYFKAPKKNLKDIKSGYESKVDTLGIDFESHEKGREKFVFRFRFEPIDPSKELFPLNNKVAVFGLDQYTSRASVGIKYVIDLIVNRIAGGGRFWEYRDRFGFQKGDYIEFFVNFGDGSTDTPCQLAYDIPASSSLVAAIPDHRFYTEKGNYSLRNTIHNESLDDWGMKKSLAFWRGTTSGRIHKKIDKNSIENLPRYKLCELSVNNAGMLDARISKTSRQVSDTVKDEVLERMRDEGVWGDVVDFTEFSHYKYLVEIDGNVTPWSFFQKLMMGSCVLRVESDRKQWFYHKLEKWVHYVPVRKDMSDLLEKIQWCKDNDDRAREIALNGQRLADSLSFDSQMNFAAEQLLSVARVVEEK